MAVIIKVHVCHSSCCLYLLSHYFFIFYYFSSCSQNSIQNCMPRWLQSTRTFIECLLLMSCLACKPCMGVVFIIFRIPRPGHKRVTERVFISENTMQMPNQGVHIKGLAVSTLDDPPYVFPVYQPQGRCVCSNCNNRVLYILESQGFLLVRLMMPWMVYLIVKA